MRVVLRQVTGTLHGFCLAIINTVSRANILGKDSAAEILFAPVHGAVIHKQVESRRHISKIHEPDGAAFKILAEAVRDKTESALDCKQADIHHARGKASELEYGGVILYDLAATCGNQNLVITTVPSTARNAEIQENFIERMRNLLRGFYHHLLFNLALAESGGEAERSRDDVGLRYRNHRILSRTL